MKPRPEPGKLIKVFCYDWSPYTAIGMFLPYKGGKNKGKTRFCMFGGGEWHSSHDVWADRDSWEYIETFKRDAFEDIFD